MPPRDGGLQALPQAGGAVGGTVTKNGAPARQQWRESGLKPTGVNGTLKIVKLREKLILRFAPGSGLNIGASNEIDNRRIF